MGKNSTKAEKAARNKENALKYKKKPASFRARRPYRPAGEGSTTSARPMFSAICSTCGAQTTVPFEPISGKPIYCQQCFQAMPRS